MYSTPVKMRVMRFERQMSIPICTLGDIANAPIPNRTTTFKVRCQ